MQYLFCARHSTPAPRGICAPFRGWRRIGIPPPLSRLPVRDTFFEVQQVPFSYRRAFVPLPLAHFLPTLNGLIEIRFQRREPTFFWRCRRHFHHRARHFLRIRRGLLRRRGRLPPSVVSLLLQLPARQSPFVLHFRGLDNNQQAAQAPAPQPQRPTR